ncbi:zinc finger MYM-type protein 1-like [Aphis craccivora]|uniref:Zinc finger MYM-type protein 1-like n=1 Tax=Aphis craccivora TaxID=307492 RepID=A0A6G0Y0V6_APHCR|nr:zinc finger MYM-type protein 1-like [Aphis craccivora]
MDVAYLKRMELDIFKLLNINSDDLLSQYGNITMAQAYNYQLHLTIVNTTGMLKTKSLSEGNNTVRICLKMYMKKSFDNIEVTQCESFRIHNENKQFNRYIKSADKHFESLESFKKREKIK